MDNRIQSRISQIAWKLCEGCQTIHPKDNREILRKDPAALCSPVG